MYQLLLVEDDETLAMGTQFALKKENLNADRAKNLKIAQSMMDTNAYDLIVLDLKLPDGTGYDFCKKIREKSQIPIIFLTACDDEVNVVMGLDMGADDYVSKPFRINELISRIKAVLRRKSEKVEERDSGGFYSGNIALLTLEGKVTKNGQDIFLTTVEYKLLMFFMKNPGRILSRNQLLQGIWDANGTFVDDNSLSVNISRLRQKIEDDIEKPSFISTLRGMGYRWEMTVRRNIHG